MDINKIKVPENLKLRTIKQMDEKLNKRKTYDKLKPLVVITTFIVVLVLSGFAYDYFSGIKEDNLEVNSKYMGNGIIEIEVINKSYKNLQFTQGILKSWKNNEELVYLNKKGEKDIPCVDVDMPLIKGGEKKTITINLSNYDYKKLEEPVALNDGYMFMLTNSEFEYGQNWLTWINFNKKLIAPSGAYIPKEPEDNTKMDSINEIKEKYTLSKPLDEISVVFKYDSSLENPRVNLAANEGTKIYAIADGVVIKPAFSEYKGNYIIIDHSNGFFTEYTHCSEILVKNAQYVKSGDVIAKVGSTGRATGSFLGVSAKYKEENINPLLLFLDKEKKE